MVVVEGLKAGTDMRGMFTADNSTLQLTARDDVPIRSTAAEALGHREFVMTKLYRSA